MRWQVPRESPFLDKKAKAACPVQGAQKLVTGTLAPAWNVVLGPRIGTLDFQDLAALDGVDRLLGAQERHGAAQAFGIQDFVGFDCIEIHCFYRPIA